jgi:hypothetical protein
MCYELTVPELAKPFDAHTLARFRRGNDRERDLLADLSRMGRNADPGFRVVGQQDHFRVSDRKGNQVISGKVDAFIELESDRDWRAPIEVKAWSPHIVDRLETFSDVFESPWTKAGAYQLLAYLYGHEHPAGFLVLDRGGIPKLLPVVLDHYLDQMEEFLSKAERVVTHALAGTLPDHHTDAAECRRCPFYGSPCQPDLDALHVNVLTDPEFEAELERWYALKDTGKEWASLDASIKRQLRGVENAIAGPFSIIGRWQKSTKVDLPADIKRQYSVTDPKGRFVLDIEKLG